MPSFVRLSTLSGFVFLLVCATTAASGQSLLPQPPALLQWGLTGADRTAYEIRGVGDNGHSTSLTRVVQPPVAGAFGATAAMVDAAAYRGHSVRLRVQLRADSATTGGSSWLRIDGNGAMLALENNMANAVQGTTAWTEQVTVLDVPASATQIIFGTILTGSGTIHARDISLEAFDHAAPAWRTDRVNRSSPFYEVVDLADAGRSLTLRRMDGGTLMDNEFGTATASVGADSMRGRRVTVRAMVKTRDASAATLWVRAENGDKETLALQNNMERPIVGTTWWTEQTAVLDVPPSTERISYGLLLLGRGSISAREITVSAGPRVGPAMPGLPMNP
jgi:hypothetical protein